MRGEKFQHTYPKCFIGHLYTAEWSADISKACELVLSKFDLEPWYANDHLDTTKPLRSKVIEMIATSRYGIYDLSFREKDDRSGWEMPSNVFIELGMAIALNRPSLLLLYEVSREFGPRLPECLESLSHSILKFSGLKTLKDAIEERISIWTKKSPERNWYRDFCVFGNRKCNFREEYPYTRQLGQKTLQCHISVGPQIARADFKSLVEEELEPYNIKIDYLDELSLADGYNFLLCAYCQTVRSAPFAIYRITPWTPGETFIAIGISIALEMQFDCTIPKLLLTESIHNIPSLLSGYEVGIARNDEERKACLRKFMSVVMEKEYKTEWKSGLLLPFSEFVPIPETTEIQATKVSPQDETSVASDMQSEVKDRSSQEIDKTKSNNRPTQEARENLFHISDQSFETEILMSNEPAIVHFWAAWNGPCRAIAPVFEGLSKEYQGKLKFAKMDTDQNERIPFQYRIQAIPTLIIFKDGREIGRLIGPHPSRLKNEIERLIAGNSNI